MHNTYLDFGLKWILSNMFSGHFMKFIKFVPIIQNQDMDEKDKTYSIKYL